MVVAVPGTTPTAAAICPMGIRPCDDGSAACARKIVFR